MNNKTWRLWGTPKLVLTSLLLASLQSILSPAQAGTITLQLSNAAVNQCLSENGSAVSVDNCQTGTASQTWKYNTRKKTLESNSGQCIDGKSRNNDVILKSCSGKKEQQWRRDTSANTYKNARTGQCLTLTNSQPLGIVGSASCDGATNQQWPVFTAPPPSETDSLVNGAHGQCLNSGSDPFVDVRSCNDSSIQKWVYNSNTRQLISTANKCVAANNAFNLVTQESCSSSTTQHWTRDIINNNLINTATGQCLDVWGGELDNEVGVWTCDGSARQNWKFANEVTPPPSGDSTNIVNLAQGQCMNTGVSGEVNARDCDTNALSQQWIFDATIGTLTNTQGLCVDAATPLDLVALASCNAAASQQWHYDAITKNYINAANGQCLDVWGGARDNEIGVWICDDSARQQFEKYASTPPPGEDAWSSMNLRFNGRDIAVDDAGKRLFYSMDTGYEVPKSWSVTTTYNTASPFTLKAQGQSLINGGTTTLANISYGTSIRVQRYQNGTLKDEYDLIFTNLPIIQLTASLITDEPKREGTFQLSSGEFTQNTATLKMGIETRGSTSQVYPKKSFSIQLGKDSDWTDELKLKLLGMRKDGDWILDATYRDTTFARNIVNHDIYREIHPYVYIDADGNPAGQPSIKGKLVELILNNSYHGVYVLSEKVDRKLLGLKKISVPEDANGNKLWDQVDFSLPANGSVLYKASYEEAAFLNFGTYRIGYEQKYPKPDSEAERWEPLDNLADLIINGSDTQFIAQIGNLMDMDSLVDYWALVLAGQAQDNTQKNFYLARNEIGKFAIITWDFDATFGMFWDGSADDSANWFFPSAENRLFHRLLTLPQTGFNTRLKTRWSALRGSLFSPDALAARFQQYIDQTTLGGARQRNAQRWPGSGGAGINNPELGTAAYIRNLLADRLDFVDGEISALP
jgi:hypothetical protein